MYDASCEEDVVRVCGGLDQNADSGIVGAVKQKVLIELTDDTQGAGTQQMNTANTDDLTKTKGDTGVKYTREDTGGAINPGDTHQVITRGRTQEDKTGNFKIKQKKKPSTIQHKGSDTKTRHKDFHNKKGHRS